MLFRSMKTLTATSKMALPNYRFGWGDNMWAIAIVILECIFGFPPSLEFGLKFEDIFQCIREKNFYTDFKESEVYKEFYQDDEEFEIIDEFLKLALVQDPKERDNNLSKQYGSKSIFKVDQETLKTAMSDFL